MIFLTENCLVTAMSLLLGYAILRFFKKTVKPASKCEWLICLATNVINTVITYLGFWLWLRGDVIFSYDVNWRIITDFLAIFLLMDLLMYIFHYIIHHSIVYKAIHSFHHRYEDPIPIDLFVLHPLETVSFGMLWLITLLLSSFNFYAVFIYLAVNVAFGTIGHLGFEPFPAKLRGYMPFRYLGTSSFHHRHHLEMGHNFGFYTNIWDKLFKTYKA